MGFTVACARCHNHFHDPIPTADYYSLYGIFDASNKPAQLPLIGKPDENSTAYIEFKKKLNELQAKVDQYLQSKLDIAQSKKGIEEYIKVALKAMKLKRTILKHWQESENSIPNWPIVGGIILKEKQKLSKASSNLYWSLQNPSLRQSVTSNGNHPSKLTFPLFYERKSKKRYRRAERYYFLVCRGIAPCTD